MRFISSFEQPQQHHHHTTECKKECQQNHRKPLALNKPQKRKSWLMEVWTPNKKGRSVIVKQERYATSRFGAYQWLNTRKKRSTRVFCTPENLIQKQTPAAKLDRAHSGNSSLCHRSQHQKCKLEGNNNHRTTNMQSTSGKAHPFHSFQVDTVQYSTNWLGGEREGKNQNFFQT